ncbi:zinc metalloprotease [Xanthomonas oryzae pv. oryzae]|nr:zinc metalloprotease [Xanthomonas oryzae pv. oryzae]BAE70589.1 conserved hypothetical protein [Xanthomonas oryzae pv. oryzae MAFF 311018]
MQFHVLGAAICCALSFSAAATAVEFSANAAVSRAQSLLGNNASALANRASADAFIARDSIVDADGTEHVRFDRTYQGLPVIGGDVVVHSRRGVMRELSQTMETTVRPSLVPGIESATALGVAGSQFDVAQDAAPRASLALYARQGAPRLVYEVIYNGVNPIKRRPKCITSSMRSTSASSNPGTRCIRCAAAAPARPAPHVRCMRAVLGCRPRVAAAATS